MEKNVPRMGVIVFVTPRNTDIRSQAIKRLQKKQLDDTTVKSKGISVTKFSDKLDQFPQFKPYKQFKALVVIDSLYDVIWHSGWIFSSQSHPRPNWSGFMQQLVYKNEVEFQQSYVLLLPIIDLPPTNLTCIYSALLFMQDQAKKMNISVPCVTFDQPLWHKSSGIIAKKKKLNIICRLGGFHTLMSFLGAVGDMMSGSGIEELLELVYAMNSVGHMLSGKAFARFIRGHFLVDSCLNKILINKIVKEENNPEGLENIGCLEWV